MLTGYSLQSRRTVCRAILLTRYSNLLILKIEYSFSGVAALRHFQIFFAHLTAIHLCYTQLRPMSQQDRCRYKPTQLMAPQTSCIGASFITLKDCTLRLS